MSFLVAALVCVSAGLELHPAPQSAYLNEKKVLPLERDLPLVYYDEATQQEMSFLTPLFDALGFKPTLVPASSFNPGDRAIYVGVVGKQTAFEHRTLKHYVPDPAESGDEAYCLYIGNHGIVVAGVDESGMIRGIQTLVQLLRFSRESGLNHRGTFGIPYAEIHDSPDFTLRGAYVRGALTRDQLDAFAGIKCNMLIFESDDFYEMDEEQLALWKGVFEDARTVGITPVPVFQIFDVPDILLKKMPSAVEGRSRIEKLTLSDDDWSALTRRNILFTKENPFRIRLAGKSLQYREDYVVSEGSLDPPFDEDFAAPWMIRRIAGGAVAANSEVEVIYSYAPRGSNALCPTAPETRVLLRNALETLLIGLKPQYIHCGGGEIGRLAQDLRCRDTGKTGAQLFCDALGLLQGIIADVRPDTALLIWGDALLPNGVSAKDTQSLSSALETLPGKVTVIPRFDHDALEPGEDIGTTVAWMVNRGVPPLAAVSGSAVHYYRIIKGLGSKRELKPGVIILDADPHQPDVQSAFNKAWRLEDSVLPWPEFLNDFFGSALWAPDFEEIKQAILQFVERQIVAGVAPGELEERFKQYLGQFSEDDVLERDGTSIIKSFLSLVLHYLELEYEYSSGEEGASLRELNTLLRKISEIDVTVDPDRMAQIHKTVENQGLFVPSSILLGRPLAYYRPFRIPAETTAFEAPARVEYADEKGRAQANLDFLIPCGPIFRVDFETVNAASVTLEGSDDGVDFEAIAATPGVTGRSIRGPILLKNTASKRFLRLTVESAGEQAVLREVRAFFLKEPARVICPLSRGTVGGSQDASKPRQVGMLFAQPQRLAVAPTDIRMAATSESLVFTVNAVDPLPHAMSATMTRMDDALWEEESVEIVIKPEGQLARRFVFNPMGTRHDAMAVASNMETWDSGWDGDWQVTASRTDGGWTAIVKIPTTLLGRNAKPGDSWRINFVRHRNNVEKETSVWAAGDYGALTFE